MFHRQKISVLISLLIGVLSHPSPTTANTLTAEDMATDFRHKELGIFLKIPHTWTHETSEEAIDKARESAQDLTSQVLGISKEEIQALDEGESEKGIVLRMHSSGSDLPAAQITTRFLSEIADAPSSAAEHLTRYIGFIENMTDVVIVESIKETELNGSPCAHVAYHAQVILGGYTYLARYDIYSFMRRDRVIDFTLINDRKGAFKAQSEMENRTVLGSIKI